MSGIKEISFKLTSPLDYHDNGQAEKTYELLMRAPSMAQHKYVSALKSGFFDRINILQEKSKTVKEATDVKKDQEMTGKDIVASIYASGVGNADEYFEKFINICNSGSVKLPDGSNLTKTHINLMNVDDFENMCGEYLLNFILGSLFQKELMK